MKEYRDMSKSKPILALAVTAGLFGSVVGAQAQGLPSWCNTQESTNLSERTICATRALWIIDDQLNILYESALTSVGAERPRLQQSQRDWVRVTRNGCNSDDTCLADVYGRRIDVLRRIDNRGHMNPGE
jgi:uncharacterized protein